MNSAVEGSLPPRLGLSLASFCLFALLGGTAPLRAQSPGTIETIVAKSPPRSDSGSAADLALQFPRGLTLDAVGNFYFLDGEAGGVRKMTPDGSITTLMKSPDFLTLSDLALHPSGHFYFVDSIARKLYRLELGKTPEVVIGPPVSIKRGGSRPQSPLIRPVSLAADSKGNLFIGDEGRMTVWKYGADGVLSEWIAPQDLGYTDKLPPASSSGSFRALAVDGSDTLYVTRGPILYRSPSKGRLERFADLQGGFRNEWSQPIDLAFDAAGNLYVADPGVRRIRFVTPKGQVSSVAGNSGYGFSPPGGAARESAINFPLGVAVAADGSLLFSGWDRIQRVDSKGLLQLVAGGVLGDGGPAQNAVLRHPNGIAFDPAGNLYIADFEHQMVRKVSPDGTITRFAGTGEAGSSGDGGPATEATLSFPTAVTADRDGNVYIGNSREVRKVTPDGIIQAVPGLSERIFVGGLAADDAGNLYISDLIRHRVIKLGQEGNLTHVAGNGRRGFSGDGGPASQAALSAPRGIALRADGSLAVADFGNARVRIVKADGTIHTLRKFSVSGVMPHDVAADRAGNVFVSVNNLRVYRLHPNGGLHPVAGNGNFSSSGDGGPATAAAVVPQGLAVDAQGNLLIADSGFSKVRKVFRVAASGLVAGKPFAGAEGIAGDADLNGTVEISDAVLALNAIVGKVSLTPEQRQASDMNKDGEINVLDVMEILFKILGIL